MLPLFTEEFLTPKVGMKFSVKFNDQSHIFYDFYEKQVHELTFSLFLYCFFFFFFFEIFAA